MFCDRCGAQVNEGQNFCPSCGRSFEAPLVVQSRPRVPSHLKTLGVLWIVYSVINLIPSSAVFFFATVGPPWWRFEHGDMPPFLQPLLAAIGGFGAVVAVLGIITGTGLLQRRTWARVLAIVLGCLALLSLPSAQRWGFTRSGCSYLQPPNVTTTGWPRSASATL